MADLYAWAAAGTTQIWSDASIWSTSNATDPGTTPGTVPGVGDIAHVGSWSQDFVIQLDSDVTIDRLVNGDWRSSSSGSINCRLETDGTARLLTLSDTTTSIDASAATLASSVHWIDDNSSGNNLNLVLHGPTTTSSMSCRFNDLTVKSSVTGGVSAEMWRLYPDGNLTVETGVDFQMVGWVNSTSAGNRTYTINGTVRSSSYQGLISQGGTITFTGNGSWRAGSRSRCAWDFGTSVDFSQSPYQFTFENTATATPVNLVNGHTYGISLAFSTSLPAATPIVFPATSTWTGISVRGGSLDLATNNSQIVIDESSGTYNINNWQVSPDAISAGANSEILVQDSSGSVRDHTGAVPWRLAGTSSMEVNSATTTTGNFLKVTVEDAAQMQMNNSNDINIASLVVTSSASPGISLPNSSSNSINISTAITLTNATLISNTANDLELNIGVGVTQSVTGSTLDAINATGGETLDAGGGTNTNADGNTNPTTGLAEGPSPGNNNVKFAEPVTASTEHRRLW